MSWFFSKYWDGYKAGFLKGLESAGTLREIEKKKIHDDAIDEILVNNLLMRDVASIKERYEKIQRSLCDATLKKADREKFEHYLEALGWCFNERK